jgi:hypothetical protein
MPFFETLPRFEGWTTLLDLPRIAAVTISMSTPAC